MNVFRCTSDRSLDREYLRVCAIYQSIKRHGLTKSEAAALANRPIRGVYKKPGWLTPLIEIWLAGPLRNNQ